MREYTIDHDKLLIIVHKLSFPEACIEVIADLYTGAKTRFTMASRETAEVKINRGTLQGDNLSPLLFIIFIEPLLRWLQSEGRGYCSKYACSTDKQQPLTAGSFAFADDLNINAQPTMGLALPSRGQ